MSFGGSANGALVQLTRRVKFAVYFFKYLIRCFFERADMPKSVHMICHCNGKGYRGYRGLFEEEGRLRSEAWKMDESTAAALKGGWAYFHESRNQPSTFLAQIVDTRVRSDGRMMLILEEREEPRNHRWGWRGRKPTSSRSVEENWYSIVDFSSIHTKGAEFKHFAE